MASPRIHGGTDALGVPAYDFSTNSNACGPCPAAISAIKAADPCSYPDAGYADLRQQLADFHSVDGGRIVLAGSASEFIFRITAWCAMRGGQSVALPRLSYGDYAHAAQAYQLRLVNDLTEPADLSWACDPSSPLGTADGRWPTLLTHLNKPLVLDRAYEPLRLSGGIALTGQSIDAIWQLWTPNKALGLTGIRAAYAIAPKNAEQDADKLNQLCPSWPIGADGVAMLQAWVQPEAQAWLAESRVTLSQWKVRQTALCHSLGWTCMASDANFFCVQPALPPGWSLQQALTYLRSQGIKLRDTTSFGLPGWVRLSVQNPDSQDALESGWQQMLNLKATKP